MAWSRLNPVKPFGGRQLGVGAEHHVEQQVVAGVGEQGGVQQRVVADASGQAHPVGAGAVAGRPAEESGRLPEAQLDGRRAVDPQLGRRPLVVRAWPGPSPAARAPRRGAGAGGAGAATSTPGGLAWNEAMATSTVRSPWVTVTRRVANERPSRTRSTSEVDGLLGHAALDEVGVQRVGLLAVHRRAGGEQRLGEDLPAEDPVEAARLGPHPEAVVAERVEPEGTEQAVERVEDPRARARRRRQRPPVAAFPPRRNGYHGGVCQHLGSDRRRGPRRSDGDGGVAGAAQGEEPCRRPEPGRGAVATRPVTS